MMRFVTIAVLLAGCAKPMVFEGETTLKIAGPPAAAPVAAEPPRVEVRDNAVVIHEKVQFEWDKAVILPASHDLLDQVAKVVVANPHIKKLRVEGHASAEGNARHNLELSEQRAAAVRTYLVAHGVAATILSAQGFGIERPIADNSSPSGREANRRVEFNIVEQDVTQRRVEIDNAGKERIVEEKRLPKVGGASSSRSGGVR
jgi:outer membrane protein OmpA-like peptidoglycan-associated protein